MRWFGFAVLLVVTFVAVPARAADFTVSVPVCCSSYSINGVANPPLSVVRGHTYTFNVSSPGHPFYIKTAQVTGTGSTWDEGVTNNGTTAGTVTFTVPADAPSTLFYQCAVHSAMTGTIQVAAATPVPAAGPGAALLLALGLAGFGVMAMRRRRRA
jgi:hypothetical protein